MHEYTANNETSFLQPSSRIDISNRHLPHWQLDGAFYFVTWRLADALPQSKLHAWKKERIEWLREHPKPWNGSTRREYKKRFPRRSDEWLDRGYGECVLRTPPYAQIVFDALLHFNGARYDMASFVVMPNHVHTLFQLRGSYSVETLAQSWKGYTARRINQKLGRRGVLWQAESWDRLLRGVDDLKRCFFYIKQNPAMAGLKRSEYMYYEVENHLPESFTE